ncbi:MAG: HPr family phosphocarrier protein [Planctomycetota bacterium]|nr:HPr family phosphocarrier protein [Planctomycetota bacterium]
MSIHEIEITLINKHGLHARPATQFVQLANKYEAKVEVFKNDLVVDGKSVTSMLTLGAEKGATLRIRTEGQDADKAIDKLVELIKGKFGEE